MFRPLLVGLFLLSGCAHLPHPTGPEQEVWRDRYLIGPEGRRLLIELDEIEGSAPRPGALAGFLERLDDLLDKPDGIELVLDERIPRSNWPPEEGAALKAFARRHRDLLPARRAGRLVEAGVHLLYGPRYRRYRGYTWHRELMAKEAGRYDGALLVILASTLRPILWVTGVRQEESVLMHEFGHAVGLAADPSHSMKGHCTNAWCLMYDGIDARTFFLYFFPTLFTGYLPLDWCGDCRADLYGDDVPTPGQARRSAR